MATSYTPNLDMNLPEIGASRDTWGTLLNENFSTLDAFVSMAMPIGSVLDFCGPTPPAGWLVADGRLLSRTTYSALFAVIGTYWGAGDGSTTFALPNLCGRAGVGPGTVTDANGNTLSLSFAQTLGALSNQILQAHLPNYAMTTDVQGYHSHGGGTGNAGGHSHSTDVQGYHGHGVNDPGHSHGVSDPGHSHAYDDYTVGGSGSVAGGAGYGVFTTPHPTYPATTGISINGSGVSISIAGDGAHGHNISFVGDHAHGINGDGSHQHTIYLGGSGVWFPILSPLIVLTKIIYAGQQAASLVLALSAAPTIEGHADDDDLTSIREELAQLRAQIGFIRNPPNPRRLAAPLRGSH